jgi:hypothetical protein
MVGQALLNWCNPMTDPPLPTGYRLFEAFWKLLRGNPKLRFASLLVRSGTTLAAGPPLVLALATLFTDVAFPRPPEAIATALAIAAPLLGVVLIGLGIWLFVKQDDPPILEDHFGIWIADGQTFEMAMRTVLAHEKKVVSFPDFSPEELARLVRKQELEARSSLIAAGALGGLVVGQVPFPDYHVIEHETTIEIRRAP